MSSEKTRSRPFSPAVSMLKRISGRREFGALHFLETTSPLLVNGHPYSPGVMPLPLNTEMPELEMRALARGAVLDVTMIDRISSNGDRTNIPEVNDW